MSSRLRAVPLSLSPSCEMRKKPAIKKMAARDPGGVMHEKRGTLFSRASRPQDLTRPLFFSRRFLSRLARRTKRKRDYS